MAYLRLNYPSLLKKSTSVKHQCEYIMNHCVQLRRSSLVLLVFLVVFETEATRIFAKPHVRPVLEFAKPLRGRRPANVGRFGMIS